jgi:hypothetical protein
MSSVITSMAQAHGNAHRDNDILRSKQLEHLQCSKLSPKMSCIGLFAIAFILGGLTQRQQSPLSGDIPVVETRVSRFNYSSKVARAADHEHSPQIALRESHVP